MIALDATTVAALSGALVGGLSAGVATVVATVIANRRHERRGLRADLYDRHLPSLITRLETATALPTVEGRNWGDLTRLVMLCGRSDVRRWEPVEAAARAFKQAPPVIDAYDDIVQDGPAAAEWRRTRVQPIEELAAYFNWLEARLGLRPLDRGRQRGRLLARLRPKSA